MSHSGEAARSTARRRRLAPTLTVCAQVHARRDITMLAPRVSRAADMRWFSYTIEPRCIRLRRRSCTRRRLSGTQNRDLVTLGRTECVDRTPVDAVFGESADFTATDFEITALCHHLPSTEEPRNFRIGWERCDYLRLVLQTDRRRLSIPVAESAYVARRWSRPIRRHEAAQRATASPAFRFAL